MPAVSVEEQSSELARLREELAQERRVRLEAEALARQRMQILAERQRQIELLHLITATAYQAASPADAIHLVLDQLCIYFHWPIGFACLPATDESNMLVCSSLWSVGDGEHLARFKNTVEGTRVRSETGLMAQALTAKKPAWVADVATDTQFPGALLAVEHGLRSAFAIPASQGQEVMAVLIFVVPSMDPPDESLLGLLTEIGRELGSVIERKRAEQSLQHGYAELEEHVRLRTTELSNVNLELGKAARLKDEFLASMSHELRTPLNAILGFSEALQELVYGPLNERQIKTLGNIEESGRHLLSLINDILEVSKIEAGKMELVPASTSLEAVCQASLRLIKPSAQQRQLRVSYKDTSGAHTVWADERRLKQILVNLLSNAVKFTPPGGAVGLEVSASSNPAGLRFAVWDTGIGIAPEQHAKLFQPFVQLDSRLARQYAGTGLGLALVHRLTRLHGGSVEMESQPGCGSRFTVWIPERPTPHTAHTALMSLSAPPAAEAERRTPPSPAAVTMSASSPLILLAEDNEPNVELLVDYLGAHGYRLQIARNGVEAIQQAKSERPDLILMDMHMPMLDGLAATSRIKADPELADIPIVALTALTMSGDRERCIEAGVDEYLSKPVDLKLLLATVKNFLSPPGRQKSGDTEIITSDGLPADGLKSSF